MYYGIGEKEEATKVQKEYVKYNLFYIILKASVWKSYLYNYVIPYNKSKNKRFQKKLK